MKIGIFDSGVGGLGVFGRLYQFSQVHGVPVELTYLGDTLRAPYGEKTIDEVAHYVRLGLDLLHALGVQSVALACNTAYVALAHSGDSIVDSSWLVTPISFAVDEVVALSARRVAVLSTLITSNSRLYTRAIQELSPDTGVVECACPALVRLIEKGEIAGEAIRAEVLATLAKLERNDFDAIVLGCTHFSLVAETIKEVVGPSIRVVDGVVGMINRIFSQLPLSDRAVSGVSSRMLVTGNLSQFRLIAHRLFGIDPNLIEQVILDTPLQVAEC
jgi:glutamate racemase